MNDFDGRKKERKEKNEGRRSVKSHAGKMPTNYECKVMVILISSEDGKNGCNKADILLFLTLFCHSLPFLGFFSGSKALYYSTHSSCTIGERPISHRVIEIQYAYLTCQLAARKFTTRFISPSSPRLKHGTRKIDGE